MNHIPDYDVLLLAFPPNTSILAATRREDYFARISHDPLPMQRMRLLGFGEYMHEGTAEAGTPLHFPVLPARWHRRFALREAGMPERARVIEDAIALFGPTYPVDDAKRSEFFARSFLRIKDGASFPDLTSR